MHKWIWRSLRVKDRMPGNRICYINNRTWIVRKWKCGLSSWVSPRIYPVKYAASGRSREKHLLEKYGCCLSRCKSQRAYDIFQIFPRFLLIESNRLGLTLDYAVRHYLVIQIYLIQASQLTSLRVSFHRGKIRIIMPTPSGCWQMICTRKELAIR